MQLAGMASNRGRNLRQIAATEPGGAELAVVLANREDAPVLEAATERGIPTEVVSWEAAPDRETHERRVRERLADYEFDLLALDGYMRVLTAEFVDAMPTILNVHPSLLPAFPGMDTHEQVLESGVRLTGCTVHVVDATVDGGPIVTQEPIPVFEDDDADSLKRRVLYEGEFSAYPRAVRLFATDQVSVEGDRVHHQESATAAFPRRRLVSSERAATLRYGENPHQEAAVYADAGRIEASVVQATQQNPDAKALSYNNYNDADGALELIKEFDAPAAAVIKHANPAGCATADGLAEAYERALATDPMSAFGGVVALNRPCDAETAELVTESFKEVVLAPAYTESALARLKESESLRVLETGPLGERMPTPVEKQLTGGRLVQDRDLDVVEAEDLEVVTERAPTDAERRTMLFAWRVVRHITSNAILFATGTETVGVGMGQVSRVDAVRLAAMKAEEHAEGKGSEGAVMASDAFFPFPDGIEAAAEAGIAAIVQPGGSVNDEEVIQAADDHDIAMAVTGRRAFRHG